MAEQEIGVVTRYFGKIGVAAIRLSDDLKVGDRIRIQGKSSEVEQVVDSMQIDRENVDIAGAGEEIGIKLDAKVRPNDAVFKVEE